MIQEITMNINIILLITNNIAVAVYETILHNRD